MDFDNLDLNNLVADFDCGGDCDNCPDFFKCQLITAPENERAALLEKFKAEEASKNNANDNIEEPTEEVVEEAVAEEPTEEVVEEAVAEEPAEEVVEEAVAEEPTKEVVEEAVAEEPTEEVVEEAVAEEPTEEVVEEAVAEEPTEEVVEEAVAEEPTEEVVEEAVAEEPAEEVVEEAVAEEPTEEVVEEAVAEEPTEEVVEEVAAEAPVEEVVEEAVAEAPTEEVVEEIAVAEALQEAEAPIQSEAAADTEEEKPASESIKPQKEVFKLTSPENFEELNEKMCQKRGRKLIYRPNEVIFEGTYTVLGTDKKNEEGIKIKDIIDAEIKQGVKLGYIDKYDGLNTSEIKEEYENDILYEYAEQEFKKSGVIYENGKIKVYLYDWDGKSCHHVGYIDPIEAADALPYFTDKEKYSFDLDAIITGGKAKRVVKDETGKIKIIKEKDGNIGIELDVSVLNRKD